ncbi:calmodulin-regulated spectrin-associated protein 3 [Passerculus sandwichensis]
MVAAPPAAAAAMRRGFLVPEIRPLDQYDGNRARSAASLAWAIATGYGGAANVPEELRDPFYTDQYAQEHLKPPVERLLLASDIYCRAWSHALAPPPGQAPPPAAATPPPQDLGALLALLAGRGLPPTLQGVPVKAQDLQQKPIRMVLGALGIGSCRKAAKRRGGGTAPSLGVPESSAAPPACGHKHAIAFCLKESGNKPPVIRYRKDKGAPPAPPPFPPVRGLQDLASGGVLAAAIHFYCPQSLRLEEIRLGAPLALPDRLHNLGLVRDFGARHLRTRCPLAVEDLLYMAPALKLNVGAFLAELFLCFEVLRPPFVTPRQLGGISGNEGTPNLGRGDLTFGGEESPGAADAPNPKSSSPGFNFRHPLLAGGGQPPGLLPHSPSLPHGDAFGKGWSKRPLSHPLSQAVSFSIPFGLDSDVDIVMGNPVGVPAGTLARSASSDSLSRPLPPLRTPQNLPNGVPEPPEPPSIEEALQIIHSSERLLPDGAPDAFFLHSPEPQNHQNFGVNPQNPPQNPPQNFQNHPQNFPENAAQNLQNPPQNLQNPSQNFPHNPPQIPPQNSQNFPQNLQNFPQNSPQNPQNFPQNPSQTPPRPMTSFAERKKKLEEAAPANPPGGPGLDLGGVSTPPGGPPESGGGLSAEMSQLGARLEEKRRAIEAQKKRIEAIFAKHRQRLGQSALQRLRQSEEGAPPALPEDELSLGASKAPQAAPPGQYEAAVARLSAALSSLQLDMQRLTQQQERLLEQRPHGAPQAWVIPLPKSTKSSPKNAPGSPAPARKGGGGGGSNNNAGNPTPPGTATTAATTTAGPVATSAAAIATGGARKAPPRSPRRPRPAELRLPPLTRVLSPPHDVDSLPHLRRFSPSQVPVQTRSSLSFAQGREEEEEEEIQTRSSLRFAQGREEEEEEEEQPSPQRPPVAPPAPPESPKGPLRARACGDGTSDASLSPGDKGTPRGHRGHRGDEDEEDEEEEEEDEEEEGEGDSLEGSPTEGGNGGQRASVGFFCKLDDSAPDPSPPRRAPPPLRQRRLWGAGPEPEPEPEPERPPPQAPQLGEGSRRGEFTRLEYERRQQLRLMEELEKVLRPPRGTPAPKSAPPRGPPQPQLRGGGSRRARCCDDSALGRSPPKGLLGSRLSKVYSQSSLSLSSVAEPGGGRSTSRAGSPSGPGSPNRAPPPGREWDQDSNPSSPGPEYTGPRLYKEPTARSNRPLIQNALAHCVLAGTPNAPLRAKVLQEMEQSSAQQLLILFRDGGCQFRGVYALGGIPPSLRRLSGSGPRSVPLAMVEALYKYQSDQRRFCRLPARTMSGSVDAFTIPGHLWHPKKPGTPK